MLYLAIRAIYSPHDKREREASPTKNHYGRYIALTIKERAPTNNFVSRCRLIRSIHVCHEKSSLRTPKNGFVCVDHNDGEARGFNLLFKRKHIFNPLKPSYYSDFALPMCFDDANCCSFLVL